MKTFIATMIILLCLFFAAARIGNFLSAFVPPAKIGECIEVQYAGRTANMLILNNGSQTATIKSLKNHITMEVEYVTLRNMMTRKVKCP
jgi:hypothetical protein